MLQTIRENELMKIDRKFNTLSLSEYLNIIENHKQYSDFNTLGLYRSIFENENITLDEKIQVREFANRYFEKTFEFLQIKDPWTFIKVKTLGLELTNGDKDELWRQISKNQKLILKKKRIKHQNFGEYSKHNCGYDTCAMDGIMIKQGSYMAEYDMCIGNINKNVQKQKSDFFRCEKLAQWRVK